MINIGDKVKFLNAVGGGKVTAFQSKKVAIVTDHDGFEIPVLVSELVKIEENQPKREVPLIDLNPKQKSPIKEQKPKVKPAPAYIEGNDDPKFFMAFYPENQSNPVDGEIGVYLINDSNFSLLYHYVHFDGTNYTTIDTGILEPNTKTGLESLSQTDLSTLPRFHFRLIPFRNKEKNLTSPIVKEVSVNAVKFYKEKSFTSSTFFRGRAMVFDLVVHPMQESIEKLTEGDFKAVVALKDKEHRPRIAEKPKIVTPETVEVDLHIENLIEKTSGLSNHEILEIQMARFHSEMQSAIEKRAKRIIFIHGVGNGVLKQEIHKKLKSTYARFYFQDASFQEYGYGATMVIIRRN